MLECLPCDLDVDFPTLLIKKLLSWSLRLLKVYQTRVGRRGCSVGVPCSLWLTCDLPGVRTALAISLGVEALGGGDCNKGGEKDQGGAQRAGHLRARESEGVCVRDALDLAPQERKEHER